jgi:hypothetical protein
MNSIAPPDSPMDTEPKPPALPPWPGGSDTGADDNASDEGENSSEEGNDDYKDDGDDNNFVPQDDPEDDREDELEDKQEEEFTGDLYPEAPKGHICGSDPEAPNSEAQEGSSTVVVALNPAGGSTTVLKTFQVSEVGALGLKVEEGDCDMIVKNVVQGKGADMSGLRAGDHIISATVEGTKGGFISSMHWNESMPAHELYKVLMSKRRPMFMKASRKWSGDDASDDRAFEGKRQRAMDEYDVLEPVTKKKRGRPSLNKVKIDHEELTRQEVNQLGQWRENILRANELRLAATEIDMHNFPSSGISGKGATDAGAIHSTMGSFAVQSLKSHIQSLREEAEELWTNPRHTSWENSLKEYIAFKKEYGHGKMTKEMREKGDLFDWALRMREKYRNLNREGKTLRNKLMRIMEYAILCKVG